MNGAALVRADSIRLPLGDDSVDLIVTSPPYFALRSYQDDGDHYDGQIGSEPGPGDFIAALWAVTAECKRVLKPSGSMFVNLGDKYAGSCGANDQGGLLGRVTEQTDGTDRFSGPRRYNQAADVRAKSLMGLPWLYAHGCTGALAALGGPDPELDLILRAEIIWSKPNGMPESVQDRARRSHEQWFHLTKEERYFSALDEIRERHAPGSAERAARGFAGNKRLDQGAQPGNLRPEEGWGTTGYDVNPLGRLPGSVWTIATEPLHVPAGLGVDHFAAFPQEWPRRFILGWSPSGVCVECGVGRFPVVDRQFHGEYNDAEAARQRQRVATMTGGIERQIVGYACSCDEPTAPTRPAVVLDPFGGTGTTAMVARALGRFGVSIDLSADYLRLARWRVFESGHAVKAIDRTKADAQHPMFAAP